MMPSFVLCCGSYSLQISALSWKMGLAFPSPIPKWLFLEFPPQGMSLNSKFFLLLVGEKIIFIPALETLAV